MAVYPHASEQGAARIVASLQAVALGAGIDADGARRDPWGRQILDSFDSFFGWAREHNLVA